MLLKPFHLKWIQTFPGSREEPECWFSMGFLHWAWGSQIWWFPCPDQVRSRAGTGNSGLFTALTDEAERRCFSASNSIQQQTNPIQQHPHSGNVTCTEIRLERIYPELKVVAGINSFRPRCFATLGWSCAVKIRVSVLLQHFQTASELLKFSSAQFPPPVQHGSRAEVNNSWYVLWTQHFPGISAWWSALFTRSTFLPACLPSC